MKKTILSIVAIVAIATSAVLASGLTTKTEKSCCYKGSPCCYEGSPCCEKSK
jgi:hypothetical protein